MLFADVHRGQFGLGHGGGVIHEADHRVDVDVVIVLRWRRWRPHLQQGRRETGNPSESCKTIRIIYAVTYAVLSHRHNFRLTVGRLKHVLLQSKQKQKTLQRKKNTGLSTEDAGIRIRRLLRFKHVFSVYHVVGILSGVGEEVFRVFHSSQLLFVVLPLLLLPQLPGPFSSFSVLLKACTKHSVIRKLNISPRKQVSLITVLRFLASYLSDGLVLSDVKVLEVQERVSLDRSQLQQI